MLFLLVILLHLSILQEIQVNIYLLVDEIDESAHKNPKGPNVEQSPQHLSDYCDALLPNDGFGSSHHGKSIPPVRSSGFGTTFFLPESDWAASFQFSNRNQKILNKIFLSMIIILGWFRGKPKGVPVHSRVFQIDVFMPSVLRHWKNQKRHLSNAKSFCFVFCQGLP